MNPDPLGSVARDPAGAGRPGRYLPVSTPCAMGENTIWPMPSFSHSGSTSASMTRQSMLYCGWFETIRSNPMLPGDPQRGRDLLGPPFGDAHVEHLALADQVVEGAQGLLQRGLVVVAVRLVQVDVVGLQPAQRAVRGLHDVLAGQAAVVGARPGRPEDLGADLDATRGARRAAPGRAPPRPGSRRRRPRCRSVVMPSSSAAATHARAAVLLDLRSVGDPVAVGDLADLQAAAAEMTMFHGVDPSQAARPWPRGSADRVRSAPGLTLRLGEAELADLGAADGGVHLDPAGALAGEPLVAPARYTLRPTKKPSLAMISTISDEHHRQEQALHLRSSRRNSRNSSTSRPYM